VHQLTKASLEFMVAEEQARNTVKGFWTQLLGAMERGDLPESFGSARPPPTSSKQRGCGGLREHIAVCIPEEDVKVSRCQQITHKDRFASRL
jgi:hypothetical protein